MEEPLYELVGEHGGKMGRRTAWAMITATSDAVVGATYPEMGKVLRKLMPKSIHSGTGIRRTGWYGRRPKTVLSTRTVLAPL